MKRYRSKEKVTMRTHEISDTGQKKAERKRTYKAVLQIKRREGPTNQYRSRGEEGSTKPYKAIQVKRRRIREERPTKRYRSKEEG